MVKTYVVKTLSLQAAGCQELSFGSQLKLCYSINSMLLNI